MTSRPQGPRTAAQAAAEEGPAGAQRGEDPEDPAFGREKHRKVGFFEDPAFGWNFFEVVRSC